MKKTIYKNEVIKRRFFEYLRDVKGFAESSIDAFEKSILLWQDFTNEDDFSGFNKRTVIGFKNWLREKNKAGKNEKISLSYCYDTFMRLRTFFEWLSKQKGYKLKIDESFIPILRLSKKENMVATTSRRKAIPTLEEIKQLVESIEAKSEVDMRDRAMICLTFLTGARISAIISLPIESFDRKNLVIEQNPRLGVKTKFSKNITTALFPISYKEPLNYFLDWFDYLIEKRKFKPTDPIFPATRIENGNTNIDLHNTGEVYPKFWEKAGTARNIFKKRFEEADIHYYHPHTFRHFIVKELTQTPLTEEQKKAISQNLGHADVATTFGSYGYGRIDEERQIELVRNIEFGVSRLNVNSNLSKDEIEKIIETAVKKNLKGQSKFIE